MTEQEDNSVAAPRGMGFIRRVFLRTPRVVIALLLTGGVLGGHLANVKWSIYEGHWEWAFLLPMFLVSIFLAGAIQRLNWRHVLLMIGFLLVAKGLQYLVDHFGIVPDGYHPFYWMLRPSILVCMLFVGEAVTVRLRSASHLGCVVLAAISVAAAYEIASTMIYWAVWTSEISTGHSAWRRVYWAGLLDWPVLAAMCWATFPLAAELVKHTRAVAASAGVLVVVIVFYWIFFNYLAFSLAKVSLAGNGPFSPDIAVQLLDERRSPEDVDFLVIQLTQADWHRYYDPMKGDWRKTAFKRLSRDEATARKLTEILIPVLKSNRADYLASCLSDTIVSQHRVDLAPFLLRSALRADSRMSGVAARMLERMGCPEAALSILMESATYDRPRAWPDDDFDISPEHRSRLKSLLGVDAGTSAAAWASATDDVLDHRASSSLPPSVQADVDRELKCGLKCLAAYNRWYKARAYVARARLRDKGELEDFMAFVRFAREPGHEGYIPEWEIPRSILSTSEKMIPVFEATTAEMAVGLPNVNAPTIDDYEKEVDAYAQRVDDRLRQFVPPTTSAAPATSRATQP